MLTLRTNSKIIERILTASNGELIVATFLVTEIGGRFDVKMVSARPHETSETVITPIACLPAPRLIALTPDTKVAFTETIVSPYQDFAFFMSQPTRAPSL